MLDDALQAPGPRPLPATVEDLLRAEHAPPRLAAHLRQVHDVACDLLDRLAEEVPELDVDRPAVAFGAATHDIGKARHPEELTGPGSRHEATGERLLLSYGVPADLARFAAVHGDWDRPDATVEELLVTVADKVWKGRREPDLEQRVTIAVAAATGREPWDAFLLLDDLLTHLAERADERLAFQAAYPV
ncbi:HD domain-containing protein [Dactylosporangium sp. NPDC005572]|uniref:HD domain-containing protein n=1 Tax=Dactylosporangium sp. NPDC005572 TaxID=3156889 RepID=UPI0033B748CF